MKICIKCNLEKDENLFYKNVNSCKECYNKANKQYREDHKQQISSYKEKYRKTHKEEIFISNKEYYKNNKKQILKIIKEYYIDNKEEKSKYNKDYYNNNKEEIERYNKEYYKNNKEEILKNVKAYRKNNKKEVAESKNSHDKNRRKIDYAYRLRRNISRTISIGLKKRSFSKNRGSAWSYLNYTPMGLRLHLEAQFNDLGNEWMNWDNYGVYDTNRKTWQIDHIIPQSEFFYISMEDDAFNKCWSLANLRPLETKQNMQDGATRSRHSKSITHD